MFGIVRRLFIDKQFLKFVIVGVVNTLVGLAIMFTCYNVLHFGYWLSSALDYILASIMSYFLNKHFTFHYKESGFGSAIRFVINIAVCYLVAFSVARPVARWILYAIHIDLDKAVLENIAMLAGSGIFVIINYLGQRFFAFHKNEKES